MDPETTSAWADLYETGGARHGAFHLRRVDPLGLSRRTVRNRASREVWERPYPSVFYLPASVDGWWRTTSGRLELVGSDAALAARTAAYALGMRHRAPRQTEIIRVNGLYRIQHPDVRVIMGRTLLESDIVVVNGLRVTSPHRTLRDLAFQVHRTELRKMAIDALRDGILDLDLLVAEHATLPRRSPARSVLGRVLDDLAAIRTESPFAYEVLAAVEELGIPVEGEFPWRCPDGRIIHHDGAIPAAWVSIECDGRGKYENGSSFTTDRIRWTQASGIWRTVWVSWQRWQRDRRAVLADVERAVSEADPSFPPAERAPCACARCERWEADGRGGPGRPTAP
jgi:hypothetical protein